VVVNFHSDKVPQINSTLADAVDNGLTAAFNAPNFTLNGDLFAKIYCATDGDTCFGICANADIAGVGVRIAFYLNAFMTAALVAFSPQESPAAGAHISLEGLSETHRHLKRGLRQFSPQL
jgi:hypothetical protein